MDSNKIQNEQTNTFSGGMNTDAADHVLGMISIEMLLILDM